MHDPSAPVVESVESAPMAGQDRLILVSLLASTLLYLLLFNAITATRFMPFLARWANSPVMGVVGTLVSLVPLTLLQLLMVRYLSAWRGPLPARLGLMVGSAAVWGALLMLGGAVKGPPGMFLDLVLGPWSNLSLIAAMVLLGTFISLAIKDAPLMLPVLLVGGLVDYWGVYFGTTHHFVKNAPEIVERVSAKVPTVSFGGVPIVTTIGPGDFLFLGIFFASMARFRFDIPRTFWAFFALLLVSLMIVSWLPIPIPALVPMAIAMIGVNWRKLRLSRAEAFASFYAIGFLALLLAGMTAMGVFRR